MKFRITKIGAYVYTKLWTLSFSWRYRMQWWPVEWFRDSGGWFVGCGRFGIEQTAFEPDDEWGERRGEQMEEIWSMLSRQITDEEVPR